MTNCSHCGATIDTDRATCSSCGRAIEGPVQTQPPAGRPDSPTPQVELISRDWGVVDVDTGKTPANPLDEDEPSGPPLPPGSIEVAVDEISVVTDAAGQMEEQEPAVDSTGPADPWDHLRPKGEMPKLARRVSVAARLVQTLALVTALAAVAAGATYFYLNTRLEAFDAGRASAGSISDIELVADGGLLVVGVLAALTMSAWLVWRWRIRRAHNTSSGRAGLVALLALVAGAGVIAGFYLLRQDTATERIAANSLIILGLGLVLAAFLIVTRVVGRIERRINV